MVAKKSSPNSLLRRLEHLRDRYDAVSSLEKTVVLRELEGINLPTPLAVSRFHESLCFLRAYPDNSTVLELVESSLTGFPIRKDLRRHAHALSDSGIAGTHIYYRFFWTTASWLVERWPDYVEIDHEDFDNADTLVDLWPLLMPYAESPTWDMLDFGPEDLINAFKNSKETDASFLVRRFARMKATPSAREHLYEKLDVPLTINPGADSPSRTGALYRNNPVTFQSGPLDRSRPDLLRELRRSDVTETRVSPREGTRLIDLAREAMVTRNRDLDAFANADANDVRIFNLGKGLQTVCYGAKPSRRLVLETSYGYVTLKNGVPISYGVLSSIFGCTEVAFNLFDTFRGGEAPQVLLGIMKTAKHLFGANSFSLDPYQLGYGNTEGLKSGAWWFYYKLGFRPLNIEILKVLKDELAAMKRDPGHRTDMKTLEMMASDYLYLAGTKKQERKLGRYFLGNVGLTVTRYFADRFGADREMAIRTCVEEALSVLDYKTRRKKKAGEKLAWERWGPIICVMPGVAKWSKEEKTMAARVIDAKGGQRESEYVKLLEHHKKLRGALLKLARTG